MNICVFCASNRAIGRRFDEEARLLGKFIAESGHTLVYGGATGGLMDALAEAARTAGGKIIGVVPKRIVAMGRKSDLPTQLFVVDDMSERKELMKKYADVFVVLPGGLGTYDELFDALVSGMVGYHSKPLMLVNTDNFYNGILTQLDRMTADRLGEMSRTAGFRVCDSAAACIAWLRTL